MTLTLFHTIITYNLLRTVPNQWAAVHLTNSSNQRRTGSKAVYYVLVSDNGTITCTVSVIEGMNIPPLIEWFDDNNLPVESNENITVGRQHTNGSVSTSTLSFTPILFSHKGGYTCRTTVMVPWMSVQPASLSESVEFVVASPTGIMALS